MVALASNGFGNFVQEIVVKVSNDYADQMNGYQVVAQNKDSTEFLVNLKTTRPDDYETAIFEMHYLLSALKIPRDAWLVNWEQSSY